MAGATSLEAVKRKIKFLQEQADVAEDRAERLQQELVAERKTRDQVSMFVFGVCLPRVRFQTERKKKKKYASSSGRLFSPFFVSWAVFQRELMRRRRHAEL